MLLNKQTDKIKKLSLSLLAMLIGILVIVSFHFNQKNIPDFSLTTLDNQTLTQKNLTGKVTLIQFWATTCTTCVAEIPMLKEIQQRYTNQNYQTLAIAMSYDPEEQVREFIQTNQLPFMVATDKNNQLAQAFGNITLTPTTILVNPQGKIIATFVGAIDSNTLQKLIQTNINKY